MILPTRMNVDYFKLVVAARRFLQCADSLRQSASDSLFGLALVLPLALSAIATAQAPAADPGGFPLYLKVQVDKSVRFSSLKPGDVTEGNLSRDVYSADGKVFSAGSHVRLSVDHLERRRRVANDHWPWVVRFFTPRHQNFPSFSTATITATDGSESLLRVSLISASRRTEIHAKSSKGQTRKNEGATMTGAPAQSETDNNPPHRRGQSDLGPIMSLEAQRLEASQDEQPHGPDPAGPLPAPVLLATLPAGTDCKTLLLKSISASKSHAGDLVQARLLEPVVQDSQVVLPAGTVFEGSVIKATPPRTLSRSGSIAIAFTHLTLPWGNRIPVNTSLTRLELSRGSHTQIDAEGRLRGDRPGVAWMLINGGVTAGLAKEVDDSTQLILEALLSGATDASTAGTARIAGSIVSGIFMVTRHGRDVVLPDLTEMNLTLSRPLTMSGQVALAGTNP
jgi:hypothetical protein